MQEKKPLLKTIEEKKRDRFIEDLIAEVENDFEFRRNQRINLERKWQLNMNFLAGNQYCKINARGEIDDEDAGYFWQNQQSFNHIAPLIETRLAKFSKLRPTLKVRPKTDNDKDVEGAFVAEKLIEQAFADCKIEQVVKKVTVWSETCGSGFYKVIWDNDGGENLGSVDGKQVYEGGIKVIPVSPFEIFPDSLYNQEISDCDSIIHARAVSVKDIKEKYGVDVLGGEIGVFNLTHNGGSVLNQNQNQATVQDSAIVIEKYQKPSSEFPNGRLVTIAGGKLLYYGELPYLNGKDKSRIFPFIKQDAVATAGNFFGTSIIERLIPIQRSFNAVKNRKHEFLNRLSMGVLTVEDGSVDVEDLQTDGLSPGKVLVYRQGCKAPEIMNETALPIDFTEEENKLINEFITISGVSDVSSSSSNASLSSGSALQLLIEQDNERLLMTAENLRNCYVEIAKHVVRLFAQFTSGLRAVKYYDAFNKTRIGYANSETVRSDSIYIKDDGEFLYTDAQRKELIYKLIASGILCDETGEIKPTIKSKVLNLMGYSELDYTNGISRLQQEKAQMENEKLRFSDLTVEEIDDDNIHVEEHVKYVLSEYAELNQTTKDRYFQHIKSHKQKINNQTIKEN